MVKTYSIVAGSLIVFAKIMAEPIRVTKIELLVALVGVAMVASI